MILTTNGMEHACAAGVPARKQTRSFTDLLPLGTGKVSVIEKLPPDAMSRLAPIDTHSPLSRRWSRTVPLRGTGEIMPLNVVGCWGATVVGVCESETL